MYFHTRFLLINGNEEEARYNSEFIAVGVKQQIPAIVPIDGTEAVKNPPAMFVAVILKVFGTFHSIKLYDTYISEMV